MSDLTGISLSQTDTTTLPVIKTTGLPGSSFTYDLRSGTNDSESTFQINDNLSPYSPLFEANDENAEALGIYTSNNKPAIVRKKLPECTSYYIGLPAYEPELMKGILQLSKAHKFTDEGDIVYSGNGLLSFHSRNGGLKKLILSNGIKVKLNLEKNSTVILDNQTGKILLN